MTDVAKLFSRIESKHRVSRHTVGAQLVTKDLPHGRRNTYN
jgi:hypothetical protein